MAADLRLVALALVLSALAQYLYAQNIVSERCYYMTDAIPREPKPDDFVEMPWSGGWSDFPVIPAAPRDDVCIDFYLPGSGTVGQILIHMEEEIEGDVYIARLNYQGTQTPTIGQAFLLGSYEQLGPEIRFENDEWFLVVTRRQDYEVRAMQRYTFDITAPGETLTARVVLSIQNIDDNDPIAQVLQACITPELGEPRLTDCQYTVSDLDGRLSIEPMKFRIESERGDDAVFYIDPKHIEGVWNYMNFTLGIHEPLDFELNPLHIFQVTALDSVENSHTVTVMVQVGNVESRPPRWMEIFAVQQFDEKQPQSFRVRAMDGDTGIDRPIYYKLEFPAEEEQNIRDLFSIETFEGGRSGANFSIEGIDRDTLEREVFTLSIVAYKLNDNGVETFATPSSVVIIVDDVNDQKPLPFNEEYHISMLEETAMTLSFDEEFGFHDRDLGVHAQYDVHIESESPPGAEQAFYIAPLVGYQRQTFIMGTIDHRMLDYEDPPFQHIILKVIATDMNNTEFVGITRVYIDLVNWNDELPYFELASQEVTFDETVAKDFPVGNATAFDRDIGDRVEHTLLGNANDYLRIDIDTGDIFVSIDNAFDYHRQDQLFVQIQAKDTLYGPNGTHTTTSSLVIHLNDINNTPPTLRLPRGSPSVRENEPEGFVIEIEDGNITATDPDSTAELRFEIDWETAYATKQGRQTPTQEYHGCVEIETVFPDPQNHGLAIGTVVVKEIRPNVTIDFEEFEVMYLTVRVRDLNTVDGLDYDESTFTIIIIDMNDNWPIWAQGTLAQEFRVRERSASTIVIGSVLATDIDGPLYNQVRYTIVPRNDTPPDLLEIDFVTGQITVDQNQAIDADLPKRWHLYYTVIASDECHYENQEECPEDETFWETEGEISIQIIDTNNRLPGPDYTRYETKIYIYENAPQGTEVVMLYSNDDDRDEIYNTVRYQINYQVNSRLRDFFSVDVDTGLVYVDYSNSNTGEVLDRDGNEPTHYMFITLNDNLLLLGDGNSNLNTTEIEVILLDENDNAPELPSPEQWNDQWEFVENLLAGVELTPVIVAPDRDEPDTPNSHVGYAIFDLVIQDSSRPGLAVPRLFNILSPNNVSGVLQTAMDLKGYWGTYDITILAFDHGIPQQFSDETYQLVVRPYNFHAPVFVYPTHGSMIRLARERATTNGVLILINGDTFNRVAATDEDGLHAGTVTFQVVGEDDAIQHFRVDNDGENMGTLILTQLFQGDAKEFQVTIRATDGGIQPDGGPLSTDSTIRLVFVPTQGEPVFDVDSLTVSFIELEGGLEERHQLPPANDPKNLHCEDDCHDIYYRIVDGNDERYFNLDPDENVLYLVKELNRSVSVSHELNIAASNYLDNPSLPTANSMLRVIVNVREANPRPIFERNLYTAGISTIDTINRELLIVSATHSEGDTITYSIDYSSMAVDASLEGVSGSAFSLNSATGTLTLQIQPTSAMIGMFVFNVVATDTAGKTDTAEIRIYLISSQNRVTFIFRNTVEEIENQREFVEQTFGYAFGEMICNIDQVLPFTNSAGLPLEDRTEVRAHFIQNDMPVSAETIEEIRSNLQLIVNIQNTLSTRLLALDDLVTDISPDVGTDSVQITVYVLAGLSAILAFLCLVLLITYVVRTRNLNKRLEALSMTKYGSLDSGLNRVGIAAPGTNKHAIEGSNPIWNEAMKAPDFDAISDVSGDSDLIGIEDLPQFRTDYFPPGDTDSAQGIVINDRNRPQFGNQQFEIPNHANNFGFNTSPFSPEFTNMQFKR